VEAVINALRALAVETTAYVSGFHVAATNGEHGARLRLLGVRHLGLLIGSLS